MATIAIRMTPPTSAVGCRRNASRKRCHVGDMERDLPAIGGGTAVVELMSVAYPRIEQHVGQSTARLTSTYTAEKIRITPWMIG